MSEEAIAEEFEDELAPPEGGKLETEAKPIEDDHNEGEQVSEHDEPEYSDAEAKAEQAAGGHRMNGKATQRIGLAIRSLIA